MTHRKSKISVLFLCTGNSCRSQIAEGLTNQLKGDVIAAHSAGTAPAGIHELTRAVLAEEGIDLSRHRSKHVDELSDKDFDYVVTLCGAAAENCPRFPGKAKVVHVPFEDPAAAAGSDAERLRAFRKTRDAIREYVVNLPVDLEHFEEDE